MHLEKSKLIGNQTVNISGSKSLSNRLLILRELFQNIEIQNLSNSQDTQLLQKALIETAETVDIYHAGTAMRFLTSFFAVQEGKTTILTGSERMKQRPIKPLVNALRDLGAEIEYLENEGFPPLKITGKTLEIDKVKINSNISSQFITALLLIGAKLKNGLQIELEGEITSKPYLEMTLKMLNQVGIDAVSAQNKIKIFPKNSISARNIFYVVESDWSSASYYFSLCALGKGTISLRNFHSNSLQGDSKIKEIYWNFFGVNTISKATDNEISLFLDPNFVAPENIILDMNDCPDIAQTLCVTATALKIPFEITGLGTLKVKETDRLLALKNELFKIGGIVEITEDSIKSLKFFEPHEHISIETYNDHRMAMSFAPFCVIKSLDIQDAEVVEKSYPQFWEGFGKILIPETAQ